MKQFYILLFLFTGVQSLHAQVANTGMTDNFDSLEQGKVTVGGYADVYYGFDFNEPQTSDRAYAVSSARHNEININLIYIDVKYKNDKIRARIVPGFGTYINANYVDEKGSLKNLVEASIGVKLSKKKEIWVDAGVLASPYTNESAISKDHLMYTRSFAPEFVPYYLTGAKLSLPVNKKINAYVYLLNGWQVIQDVNNPLSLGTQVEYRPNKKILFNWDTYIGDEHSVKAPNFGNRFFTDVYMIYNPDGKLSLTSCAYIGRQDLKDTLGVRSSAHWWQANLIGRYRFNKKVSLSARLEYFKDPKAIQVKPITNEKGFSTYSGGFCLNVNVTKSALFRIENRFFYSDQYVYLNRKLEASRISNLLITSLAVWF